MRTTRELRQQTGAAVPSNPDSEYKPVVRQEKVQPEVRVPQKLQKALPFSVQEKTRAMVEEKRKRRERKRKAKPDEIPQKLIVDHDERKKWGRRKRVRRRNAMVQRLMLMRDTMTKTREKKRQEFIERKKREEEKEALQRKAAMDAKKTRSYALKGAMEKRRQR